MSDRVLHTVVTVAALALLGLRLATSDSVPAELWSLTSGVVGAYFGAAIPGRATSDATGDAPRHADPTR